ncbi:glutathione S-transferase family protein [Neoroseomonas soli]|uniref:Glutathione S-transferase n=1 Tax=Neoroseomonas soli TaxID=1081025 RepID=A0A9X9X117_9PROT|nr:glutathione S-transferase [Neoroseomonas soli]MBR0673096.1 glutathione S-transferase [Neoroseomonas soli]
MLRILGKASSINVRKVLWTCAEIGLDPVREDWGSGFAATDAPEFLALNPNGLVPVLVDDSGPLWESNTICRYLADRHGRADLLPAPSRARALVEQWMDWQATDLNTSWRQVFMARVRGDAAFADPALVAAGERAWNRNMGILDRRLAETGGHVAGEGFTLADIVLGLSVNRWLMTPMDRPALPAVSAYAERLRARPGALAHAFNGTP